MADLAAVLTPTDDDRLLQAEALVRAFCGWHIAPSKTETVTVYPDGRGLLVLPSLYVTAVTSVTEVGYTPLTTDDYRFYEYGVIARLGDWYWQTCQGPVEVEFTHGYDTPPADVTAVVQSVAARAIGNATGLKSRTTGPFAETYTTDLLPLERADLLRYRIPAST